MAYRYKTIKSIMKSHDTLDRAMSLYNVIKHNEFVRYRFA